MNKKNTEYMSTSNYGMFKISARNRPVADKSLRHLKASIQHKNLLHLRPILVDRHYFVIDGQHRLKAAQELGLPIYFQFSEDSDLEDMSTLNTCQVAWTNMDFLNFFVSGANEHYLRLFEEINRSKIRLDTFFSLVGYNRSKLSYNDFKCGKFKFPEGEQFNKYLRNLNFYQDISKILSISKFGSKSFYKTRNFTDALVVFLGNIQVNPRILVRKIEAHHAYVINCNRTEDYLEMFYRIYNYRQKNPVEKPSSKIKSINTNLEGHNETLEGRDITIREAYDVREV